jgi:uncharacterized protein (DUF433 family)
VAVIPPSSAGYGPGLGDSSTPFTAAECSVDGAKKGDVPPFERRGRLAAIAGIRGDFCYIRLDTARSAAVASVVVRDLDIMGGRPVFRGTRVPVEVLFENLKDGLSLDDIVEAYPSLSRDDLVACLEESERVFDKAPEKARM